MSTINNTHGLCEGGTKMLVNRTLLALALTAVLLISGVGASVAVGTTDTTTTELTECTRIDEPGTYVLASNITNESASTCLNVVADNVTIDGNGYTIDGVDRNGTAISSLEAVTVTDMTVRRFDAGVRLQNARIDNSTFVDNHNGIYIPDTGSGLITDSTLASNTRNGLAVTLGTNVTLVDSRIVDNGRNGVFAFRTLQWNGSVTVPGIIAKNNVIAGNDGYGLMIRESDTLLSSNIVRDNGEGGLLTSLGPARLSDDRFVSNDGPGISSFGHVTATNITVTDNAGDGIRASGADFVSGNSSVTLLDSAITDNGGDGVFVDELADATIHESTIASNADLGVNVSTTVIVNATGNDWGATDGPGSAEDEDAPFADPVTGALANGSGDEVSEHPSESGVTNVHFDGPPADTPDDGDGVEDNESNDTGDTVAYQLDVAVGGVIEDLGEDDNAFYARQNRLLQAKSLLATGHVTDTVHVPNGEITKTLDGCTVTYDAVSFDESDGTATVDVSVEDCKDGVTLTLAAYELPEGTVEFQRAVADQQELVAYETVTIDDGESTTVSITLDDADE